jgi:hypothetical protein
MPHRDARGFDARLRVTVRERLASGALFPTGPRVYEGKGSTGKHCIVCAKSILEGEIEHEVVGPTTVWAHWDCYSIWRQESDGLRQPEPAPQPDKTTLPVQPEPASQPDKTLPLHIDWLNRHDGANSTTAAYAVSMGGAKDGVGTVLIAKPKGLSALTALLRGLEIAPAEIETACRVLTEQPHYEIRRGLNVTAAVLGRLRL